MPQAIISIRGGAWVIMSLVTYPECTCMLRGSKDGTMHAEVPTISRTT